MGRGDTHGIDAKRIRASEHSRNTGIQLQHPVVPDDTVTVTKSRVSATCEGGGRLGETALRLRHGLAAGHSLPEHHLPLLRWAVTGAVHGRHVPPGAKEADGLGKAVVVDEARVHREEPHQQEDVATVENHPHDLWGMKRGERNRTTGKTSRCDPLSLGAFSTAPLRAAQKQAHGTDAPVT